MPSFAMTVPYLRTSPIHIPRRDLVLGRADSLFLRVTVVSDDSVCAQGIELSGGTGGPMLQMIVWPDICYRNSWDYGAAWQSPAPPLWTGLGTVSDAVGAFDITFPTATMASWPRRCRWALSLDWDNQTGTQLLSEGHLHLSPSIGRAADVPLVLLTDPTPPVLTDVEQDYISIQGDLPT